MKKLKLTNIIAGVRKLGAVKAFFAFMESAHVETMAELIKGLVAGTTTPVALHGCINSGSGSNYIISAGAIWHNGEVFPIAAFTGTAPGGQVPVLALQVSTAQLAYTDNTNQDTLDTRTYQWQFGASLSGLGDFSALSRLGQIINDTLLDVDGQLSSKAPLASPTFTGVPAAPTAAAATNTTQLATTAFVRTEIANLVASSPSALDTLNELATALGNDPNFATTVTNALAAKAPLASPTFTGTPAAPTAAPGTNTTQIATTAFVKALGDLKADKAKPAWTNLTPQNGWDDVGTDPLRYRITDQNELEIAGYINSGGVSSAVFANLPNGTVAASRDLDLPIVNVTDGSFARLAISGGSPTTLQIVGYIASKTYAAFIRIPLDAAS
jgi:hypothetical protein